MGECLVLAYVICAHLCIFSFLLVVLAVRLVVLLIPLFPKLIPLLKKLFRVWDVFELCVFLLMSGLCFCVLSCLCGFLLSFCWVGYLL